MDRLAELEKRITEERAVLQGLIDEYNSVGIKNSQLEEKINSFKEDIDRLSFDVGLMKKQLGSRPVNNMPVQQGMPQPIQQSKTQPIQQSMPQPVQKREAVKAANEKPNKKFSFEAFFGKNVMAVAASLLIFVSLIIFGGLIYPYLPDVLKIIIMYAISIAMTVTGFVFMQLHKENKWFLSLTAIGMGALYISIFTTNIRFGVINDAATYILIAVWAIIACILSRLKSKVFLFVGQFGIFFAVIIGTVLCADPSLANQIKYIGLLIFFIVTSTAFWLVNINKTAIKNIANHIFNLVSFSILMIGALVQTNVLNSTVLYSGLAFVIIGIILLYLTAVNVFRFIYYRVEEYDAEFPITSTIYMIITFIVLLFIGNVIEGYGVSMVLRIAGMLAAMAFTVGAQLKLKDKTLLKAMIIIPAMIATLIYYSGFKITAVTGLYLFAAGALLFALIKRDAFYKFLGFGILIIAIFNNNSARGFSLNSILESFLSIIIATVIIIAYMIIMKIVKREYSPVIKTIALLLLIFNSVVRTEYIILDKIFGASGSVFVLAAFFSMLICFAAVIYTPLLNNFRNGAREVALEVIFRLIVEYMIFMCIISMPFLGGSIVEWLFVPVFVAYGLFNTGVIVKRFKNLGVLYTAIKITFITLVVTLSIGLPNPVFSILCFVFAVASVIIGFVLKYKSVRIYGLVLSIICTIKLVIFDIDYSSTIGHAVSLFVCGIICLLISLIYTIAEKRFAKTEAEA